MNIKSEKLEEVHCTIGQRTKKPNTVTMVVDPSFIIEVVTLFEQLKAGKKPKSGLIGLKLIAEYVDDIDHEKEKETLIEGMTDSLTIDIESGNVQGDDIDENLQDEWYEGEK